LMEGTTRGLEQGGGGRSTDQFWGKGGGLMGKTKLKDGVALKNLIQR